MPRICNIFSTLMVLESRPPKATDLSCTQQKPVVRSRLLLVAASGTVSSVSAEQVTLKGGAVGGAFAGQHLSFVLCLGVLVFFSFRSTDPDRKTVHSHDHKSS